MSETDDLRDDLSQQGCDLRRMITRVDDRVECERSERKDLQERVYELENRLAEMESRLAALESARR